MRTPSGDHTGPKIDSSTPPAMRRALRQAPGRIDIRDPQFASIPRHVGMVPREPRELRAVRTQPRRGIEVITGNQNLLRTVCQRHRGDSVDRVTVVGRQGSFAVILAHTNQAPAIAGVRLVHNAIGIAQRASRRDRLRCTSGRRAVESLIGVVREDECAVLDDHGPATILVNPSTSVERRGVDVHIATVRSVLDDDVATALRRAALQPIEVRTIQQGTAQPNRLRNDQVRCNGGDPRAIRSHLTFGHTCCSFLPAAGSPDGDTPRGVGIA